MYCAYSHQILLLSSLSLKIETETETHGTTFHLKPIALLRYTDVKRKEDRSTFIRPHKGLFGLREWMEEGIDFKVSPNGADELAR